MLTFEFIQPGEFDDPNYQVIGEKGKLGGFLYYAAKTKEWRFCNTVGMGYGPVALDQISAKLKELNNKGNK